MNFTRLRAVGVGKFAQIRIHGFVLAPGDCTLIIRKSSDTFATGLTTPDLYQSDAIDIIQGAALRIWVVSIPNSLPKFDKIIQAIKLEMIAEAPLSS